VILAARCDEPLIREDSVTDKCLRHAQFGHCIRRDHTAIRQFRDRGGSDFSRVKSHEFRVLARHLTQNIRHLDRRDGGVVTSIA
jgi:hypothetical protein